MKRIVLVVVIAVVLSTSAFASLDITSELSLMNTLMLDSSDNLSYIQSGNALVTLSSSGYKNIKADIAVNVGFNSLELSPTASLDRLTLKARFPNFRILMGKTRLDWGEGELFNAGNVLFEDVTSDIPLMNDSLVLLREWLAAFTYPISSFSFLEGAIIVPQSGKPDEIKGGLRYYNSEGNMKYEGGARVDKESLIPYVSIMGSIGIDASLSASVAIPFDSDENIIKESVTFSSSIFHIFSFLNQDTLSLRLEGLYSPYKDISIFLYPSIQYQLSNGMVFSLKSIICPIDVSASVSAGTIWNIFEGLVISGFVNSNIGEVDDTFSFNDAITISIGLSSLF